MAPVQSPPDDGLGSTVPSISERAAQFTRGPWVAVPDDRAREEYAWLIEERSTPCNFVVATVVTDIGMLRDRGEATARLIAAAPDLYSALKKIADEPEISIGQAYLFREIARAALKSGEGQ